MRWATRPGAERTLFFSLITGGGVVMFGAAWLGWTIAARLDNEIERPGAPWRLPGALLRGERTWPPAATVTTAVVLVVAAGLSAALVLWRRTRSGSVNVDTAAGRLPADPAGLSRYASGGGPHIGVVVRGRRRRGPAIQMTVEDQAVVIGGPRSGKATTTVIPAILRHAGPLLVTSNKRDIYDVVRDRRRDLGRVWLFDPQGITGSMVEPEFWWNPLRSCTTVRGARKLASIWDRASTEPGARADAFFGRASKELLAQMLLAAAHHGGGVLTVYRWLSQPDNFEPIDVLHGVAGAEEMANGLRANSQAPDRQRAGVFSTALAAVAWLADPAIRRWVEPAEGRPEWLAARISSTTDTLILLSKEGEGSATALVTALTAEILEAAESTASNSPGGRLPVELLCELDECANVCPWEELPDLYSHYGSRGIIMRAYFQSFSQIVEAFGETGAGKLWSSANLKLYLGGVAETRFLQDLSMLLGEWDEQVRGYSANFGGGPRTRSESVNVQRRAVLTVDDLSSLPRGRAVAQLSGTRPVIVEVTPWMDQTMDFRRSR